MADAELISPKASLRKESWAEIWPEVDWLASRHFEEVDGGVEPKRLYNIDTRLMQQLADAGVLHVWAARDAEGRLCGYCTWNILPDVESAGLLIAQQGAWYMEPEAKGSGLRLLYLSLAGLQDLGVHCVFLHHRLQGRGKLLGRIFHRMGALPIQITYSLWIGG